MFKYQFKKWKTWVVAFAYLFLWYTYSRQWLVASYEHEVSEGRRRQSTEKMGIINSCEPIPVSSLGLRVFEKIQINCQLLKIRHPSQNVDFWFLLEKWKIWPCGAHIPKSQPLIEELWLLPLQSPLVPWSYPPSWVSPATHHCVWLLSCPLA